MSHIPSPDILELAEAHLPLTPLPARIIWENTGRMWSKHTIKCALDHLTATGKAERLPDTVPIGTPQNLYRRCEGVA